MHIPKDKKYLIGGSGPNRSRAINADPSLKFSFHQDPCQVGDGARDGARSKTPPTTPSKGAAKGKLLGVKVIVLYIFSIIIFIFPR